jgi:hypothetical protein
MPGRSNIWEKARLLSRRNLNINCNAQKGEVGRADYLILRLCLPVYGRDGKILLLTNGCATCTIITGEPNDFVRGNPHPDAGYLVKLEKRSWSRFRQTE